MELNLKLEAQDWTDRTPTQSQLINLLNNMSGFVNSLGGILLATGEYHIAEQRDGAPPQANPVAALLNAAASLKNAKDLFAGNNTSGIVAPQPGPRAVR